MGERLREHERVWERMLRHQCYRGSRGGLIVQANVTRQMCRLSLSCTFSSQVLEFRFTSQDASMMKSPVKGARNEL